MKICTTIEQSKKLIELGIDINTADMMWDDWSLIDEGWRSITLVGDGAKGKIRDACTEDYTPFKDIPIIQTNNENKTDLESF